MHAEVIDVKYVHILEIVPMYGPICIHPHIVLSPPHLLCFAEHHQIIKRI